jgi:hypothetical protein
MAGEPWVSDEARMGFVARQVFARAMRRPARMLILALAIMTAYVALRVRDVPSYTATLYFHLVEGDLTDPNNAPRPLRAIREHIANVALSRTRVLALMKKYHMSPAFLRRDPVAATDSFRDDLDIRVSRNYFLYDRARGDAPRSADVSISIAGSDPERTRAMVHDIGDAILKEQSAQRTDRLDRARDLFRGQLDVARLDTKTLQDTVDRLWLEAATADPLAAIRIRAQIAALQAATKGSIDRAFVLERRSAAVAFSAAAEGQKLGLQFDLVDESVVASAPPLTPFQLVRRAGIVFLLALLLTAPVVGAFDDRIYAREDLRAAGLPLFGALPRFPGDDAGAYRTRPRRKGV